MIPEELPMSGKIANLQAIIKRREDVIGLLEDDLKEMRSERDHEKKEKESALLIIFMQCKNREFEYCGPGRCSGCPILGILKRNNINPEVEK